MTGPDGTQSAGWWNFLAVDPGKSFEVIDGFGDAEGTPNDAMPTMRMVFQFSRTPTGSRMQSTTYFPSIESMEQLAAMGMEAGLKSALSQLDGVLADLREFAANRAVLAQTLSDTQVRISRVIRGSAADVWRAHTDAALMQQWMLGPDGWTMPVCDVATRVGDRYRYEWASLDGSQRFGFEGELLELAAPYRSVSTEGMIGMDGPPARNELTLTPTAAGTLLSLLITYPSKDVRDMVLATGMTDGMEASYTRLEQGLFAAV
jgi:uncharacterized protein YndB with AHSA1/START domain